MTLSNEIIHIINNTSMKKWKQDNNNKNCISIFPFHPFFIVLALSHQCRNKGYD